MSYAAKAWYAGVVSLLSVLIASIGGTGVVAGISVYEFLGAVLSGVVAWGGVYGIANTPTVTQVTPTNTARETVTNVGPTAPPR